ncbi:MAG: hypothetical protein QOG01_2598 [Pseudonocardiales bacterium]|nr:hypothetical protein [Pseudonocardiales bacterium]
MTRVPRWTSSEWAAPIFLIVVVGGAAAGADLVGDLAGAVIRGLGGTLAVAALVYGARRHHAQPAGAWSLVALGIAVWVIGDALWDGLTVAGVSDGSSWWYVANTLYLSMYPTLFLAVAGLVTSSGRRGGWDNLIDCAILAFGTALVLRMFVVDTDFSGNTLENVFSAAFPLGDALLVGAAAWLLFASGMRNPSAWLLAGGMATSLAADIAWDLEMRLSRSNWDAWINPMYPFSYALIAAAALHPAVTNLTGRAALRSRSVHPARLVFLCSSLAAVSFVALVGNRHDVIIEVCTVGLVAVIGIRFANLVRDTERAFQQADTSERRFRFLATAAPVGILETNPNLEIVFANEETERIFGTSVLGFTPEHLIDRTVDDRERAVLQEAISEVAAGRRANAQIRVHSDDGEDRWVAWYGVPAQEWPGPFAGAFVATVDITLLKDAEEMLALQATHDQLTGLPNRRLLFDRLSLSLVRLTRQSGAVAVLFLDLDGFKLVNDRLGHDAGDELLKIVASRIRFAVRTEDTVVRYGGDEFVVILERILSRDAVARVAAKIIEVVSAPVQLDDEQVDVTASIGIALSEGPGDDPDALLREADTAMYLSKQAGRAQFTFFTDTAGDSELARTTAGNRHHLSALPR